MFKNLLKLNALVALFIVCFMTSCTDDTGITDVENYVIESTYEIQKNHMIGRPGCYELVFPVSLEFPDGSQTEIDSYENMKEEIRAWKESNVDLEGRPTLVFPIEVINQEGELISIAEKEELRALLEECREEFRSGPGDHHRLGRFRACFDLVFPISIDLPNGNTLEIANYHELKHAIRVWRHNNPGSTDRPVIAFPIQIVYEDGSTEDINSVQELKEAKRACRE